VLALTGADGLMIGRAAQGRPWIFRELAAGLAGSAVPPEPDAAELASIIEEHVTGLYALYGERQGARIARKHIGWYLEGRPEGAVYRRAINRVETAREQLFFVREFIAQLAGHGNRATRAAA
jgi:tRNA-dihydrouridine synthase B